MYLKLCNFVGLIEVVFHKGCKTSEFLSEMDRRRKGKNYDKMFIIRIIVLHKLIQIV
jgi:hypothetical protein